MLDNKVLEISFDLNTIDHLGVKLYSTIPPMIAELVANAWDADATNVEIILKDEDIKSIIVKDNGLGMTFNELNNNFLKIGRNRRKDTHISKTKKGRNVLGKKGLGKLSVFGIGNKVTITTIKNNLKNEFCMEYNEMKKTKGRYKPQIICCDEKTNEASGTQIKLENIRRSSAFDAKNIVDNLSKRFTIFSNDFNVSVQRNNESPINVTNEEYLEENTQFSWSFPEDFKEKMNNELFVFATNKNIKGKIYTSKTPLISEKRGIVLFSRGKLVQENSSFDERANDNFFQYMSGYFNVDFIDEDDEIDVISTDRKSIAWDSDNNQDLVTIKRFLNVIVRETQKKWRQARRTDKENFIVNSINFSYQEWLKELTAQERPLAKKLGDAILNNDSISEEDTKTYFGHIRDMFSFESFKDFTAQLDDLNALEDEKAIKVLTDWQYIEAKEMAKVAEGRIKTINQFEKYINQNVSETKVMQKFLEEFPWLLDPKMTSFEREVTYSRILKENFPEKDLPESNRRIDFLCSNNAGVVHIIELKRPRIKISFKEVNQIVSYLSFLKKHCPDGVNPDEIHAILISNNYNMDDDVREMYMSLKGNKKLTIKSYDDLLSQARFYNNEFIKKYTEINEYKKMNN